MKKNGKLSTAGLHEVFLTSLGNVNVSYHSDSKKKPLLLNLSAPYPQKHRVYLFNATYPPGGRTLGERKIQLIVPNQRQQPGNRGNFDHSGGRNVLLVGYEADVDVFIFWDAGTYRNFSYSMNVQVYPNCIFKAFSGQVATQERKRRSVKETVVCAPSERLLEAIELRIHLSFTRLLMETP